MAFQISYKDRLLKPIAIKGRKITRKNLGKKGSEAVLIVSIASNSSFEAISLHSCIQRILRAQAER